MSRITAFVLGVLFLGACQPPSASPPDIGAIFDGSAGEWVDLTYAYSEEAIFWPTADGFRLEEVAYGETEGGWFYSSYNYSASEHGGTHFDAPIHFAQGGDTNEQVPLTRFIGAAAVVDVSEKATPDYLVSVDDLLAWESRHGPLPDGVILLLHTGWGERWPDPLRYLGTDLKGAEAVAELHFPGLSPEAAQWLVDNRNIASLGIDTPSIDYGQSTTFETHRILYATNLAGFENVANLELLPEWGAYVVALPMKIKGGSGGPLRIVAFIPSGVGPEGLKRGVEEDRTMTERKLRWGVLSTSNIGRVAVNPAIQASSNGELVAVASRNGNAAREFAEESGIPSAYGSYEALLEDGGIDAVYNPLPNSLHMEWSIRAADSGKHILCEKPLALNAAQCREMEAAASANGVKLMEAFMYRFHPRTERVVELVRAGTVGDLRVIRSTFTFPLTRPDDIRWDPKLGGGALMDVGCYCVNIGRTLAGAEPVEVRARANWHSSGVDEQMAGSLRFANGVLAHFDCALTMERTEVYQVLGTDGHLRIQKAFRPGSDEVEIEQFDAENNLTTLTLKGADEYRLMVEHFADCALNDLPLRYTASEAALNMRVIEALYESARNDGAEVEVR